MGLSRNILVPTKSLNFRNYLILSKVNLPNGTCGNAPQILKFNKLPDIWKSLHTTCQNIKIAEKTIDRKYGTSTTRATTASILQEIPEPRGLPIFGTLLSLILSGGAKRLHEYVDKRHRELGPVYRERIGPLNAIFVNSPHEFRKIFRMEGPTPKHCLPEAWILYNEIRERQRGLLFMDGERWLHFRKMLNKVMLLPDPAKLMSGPCHEAAKDLTNSWKTQMQNDSVIKDLEAQLYRWSIEVMLATLMGSPWHQYRQQLSRDCDKLAKSLHSIFEHSANLSMLPAKLAMKLQLPSWNKFVLSVDTALEIVGNLVPEMTQINGDGLLKEMMNGGIRDDDVISIVTDFIIAAGDTTATTMQWILLLLCKHPEWQEKLYDNVKGLHSQKETMRNSLLKGIIKEALRLYPVAPFISRFLPEDGVIDNHIVKKGELLLLSVYSSSHGAANFPQPNDFLPERWTRTNEGTYKCVLHPHGSLPFGLGARSCVGRKLAETQISLSLAEIIKNFKMECANKDSVAPILHLICVPSDSIQLSLTLRDLQ